MASLEPVVPEKLSQDTPEILDIPELVQDGGDGTRDTSATQRGLSRILERMKKSTTGSQAPPPMGDMDDATLIPEANASFLSLTTFQWISPLLTLGYARPLQATDLWKLDDSQSCAVIAERIVASLDAQRSQAEGRGSKVVPSIWRRLWWTMSGNRLDRENQWREEVNKQKTSLLWAMNDSVRWLFWSGGIVGCIGETAQLLEPLLLKKLVNFVDTSYSAHHAGEHLPSVGVGVGYAFGILGLQLLSSVCINHYFHRSSATGVFLRGGLINAIYNRSLHLTTRARATLPNGKLVNHISTDISRIDYACGQFHFIWICLVVLVVGIILLVINLGPSALAGVAFFLLISPSQAWFMEAYLALRRKTMVWTDKRAKLLHEVLSGMKIIKFFAWEDALLERIADYRTKEMHYISYLLTVRSANAALGVSAPTIATVITFLVYVASGHKLAAGDVFSSLSLFALLRFPVVVIPLALSATADAYNAISRLQGVFEAELKTETLEVDPTMKHAVQVENASFIWDAPPSGVEDKTGENKEEISDKRFEITGVNLEISRGSLVAIVGPVGSGKTSLLQGLIGEMRRTAGSVKFGGELAYCAQDAWIQNATIRDNICFGRPFEEERYWKAVHDACLDADLDVLPVGDFTEVGEKGISLSGGQKQRVNICRAIYADAAVTIFDDPLSALDAHVGESVFNNILVGERGDKTRILVTHALHFLSQADYIYCVIDGRIVEQGSYAGLLAANGTFASHIAEFISNDKEDDEDKNEEAIEEAPVSGSRPEDNRRQQTTEIKGEALLQQEERSTGAVAWDVYTAYLKAGNGFITVPLLLGTFVLMQVATVLSSYWLVWWENGTWGKPQGFYMGVYAALGVALAVTAFINGVVFAALVYSASRNLHRDAITRIMHAPMSFFDQNPLGRIMNRLSKDIDTMDNTLSDTVRMFLTTMANIIGAMILIAIVTPWFLIALGCVLILYGLTAFFYRRSAREIKRLDAILRSSLYAHFSESLSGLSTIRAYREEERFAVDNKKHIDNENRAY